MSLLLLVALLYFGACLAAILAFVIGVIVTDIRWRLHQRKRNATFIREWRLP